MKKIVLIFVLSIMGIFVFSQTKDNFFSYNKNKYGGWEVRPKECSFSFEGKKSGLLYLNESYFKQIICRAQKESFTKDELKYLESKERSSVHFLYYFDFDGIFVYGYFFITDEAKKHISEKSLYKFYTLIQKVELDTTKWGNVYEEDLNEKGKFDFTNIGIPLGRYYSFCEQKKQLLLKTKNLNKTTESVPVN